MAKSKQIRDIIYGFIEVDEQELEIINHHIFQRLRRIKQLAFTDLLYPGAYHTRFEHSLGVMQMATYMCNHILDKYGNTLRDSLQGKTKEEFEQEKRKALKVVRLAALLHDIGHAPFSHVGERLMPYRDEGKEKLYEHEDYSVKAIKEYFKDIIENHKLNGDLGVKADDVTSLLSKDSVKDVRGGLHFSLKPIISGQLDADRADYLLRDSAHIGVDYGKYDMWRLINSVTLVKGESETPVFAIMEKGLQVAESLVIARYHMHKQVYFHKVRIIYDYHATEALKEVMPLMGCKNLAFPPPSQIESYMKLDDWVALGAIAANDDGKHCRIIKNRLHYKLKYETADPPTYDDLKRFFKYETEYENKEHYLYHFGEIFKGDKKAKPWYKEGEIQVVDANGYLDSLEKKSELVKTLMLLEPKKQALYVPREDSHG